MVEAKKERWELLAERLIRDAENVVETSEVRAALRQALGDDEADRLLSRIRYTFLALSDEIRVRSGDDDQTAAKGLAGILARYLDKAVSHAVTVAVGVGVLSLLQGAQTTADEVRECISITVEIAPGDQPAQVHQASASGASRSSGTATTATASPATIRTSAAVPEPAIRTADDMAEAVDGVAGEIHQVLPASSKDGVAYSTANVVEEEPDGPPAERYNEGLYNEGTYQGEAE